MADELFNLKNAFFLGNYQMAISEALSLHSSTPEVRTEGDFYMYRAYIEQGQYRMVLDEVRDSAPPALLAVKLLAAYLSGGREMKDMALTQLKEWLSDPNALSNPHLLLVAGLVFMHEQDYKEALKHIHQNVHPELMSLVCTIYLSINRVELARKQVGLMQEQDDDATLTKLSGAWVGLYEGGEKYQDALYEFQELGEKYTMTAKLLNGMALCNLHMGKFEEAERLLQDCLSKSATDVNTLANTVVCMNHLHKSSEIVSRFLNQLKSVSPTHPWLTNYNELDSLFERSAQQMA